MHLETITTGLAFPEGPVALPGGDILVVEIHAGRLTRVSPAGEKTLVAELGGGPNGAAIGPDGRVYVCNNGGQVVLRIGEYRFSGGPPPDYTTGSIQAVDLATGSVETLYTHCGEHPLRGPNDLVFDEYGGMYFTDLGKRQGRVADVGRVYYARVDGSAIECVIDGLDMPNGVGLSPSGDRLYVSETFAGRLWWWDVEGPGRVRGDPVYGGPIHGGNFLYSSPGRVDYDSLAVDSAGNVCVASMISAGITVVSPDGALVHFLEVPGERFVTNICFGGTDLRTAYITSSGTGRLLSTTWPRPGLRLNFDPTTPRPESGTT